MALNTPYIWKLTTGWYQVKISGFINYISANFCHVKDKKITVLLFISVEAKEDIPAEYSAVSLTAVAS